MSCQHALSASDDIVFCGWSLTFVGLIAGWLEPWQRNFFTISRDGGCACWELESGRAPRTEPPHEYTTLRCRLRLDLLHLRAMRRESPDSETDFTFRLVAPEATLRIDPQGREAYACWEVGVMRAVACREALSERERQVAEERAARATLAQARFLAVNARRVTHALCTAAARARGRRAAAARALQRATRARLARKLMHALREYSRLRGLCIPS